MGIVIQQISATDRTFYISKFDGREIEFNVLIEGYLHPKETYIYKIDGDKIRISDLGDWIHISWATKLHQVLNCGQAKF